MTTLTDILALIGAVTVAYYTPPVLKFFWTFCESAGPWLGLPWGIGGGK